MVDIPQPQIPIKTIITCDLGISISDFSGSWQKPSFGEHLEFEGYPNPGTLSHFAAQMMADVSGYAQDWVNMVAEKIIEEVERRKIG